MGQTADQVLYYYLLSQGTMDKEMWSSMVKKMEMLSSTTGTGESKMEHWISLHAKPHVGDLSPSPLKKSQLTSSASSSSSRTTSQSQLQPPPSRLVQQRLNFTSEATTATQQPLRPISFASYNGHQQGSSSSSGHHGSVAPSQQAIPPPLAPPEATVTPPLTSAATMNGSSGSGGGQMTVLDPEVKERIERNRLNALRIREEKMRQKQQQEQRQQYRY